MKKILLIFLSTILFACTEDPETNILQNYEVPARKLKSVSDGVHLTTYYYNDYGNIDSLVTVVDESVVYKTTFNIIGGKLLSKANYINSDQLSESQYVYSGNNIISSLSNEHGIIELKEFEYDIAGKLSKINYSIKDNDTLLFNYTSTTEFIYNGNNIIEENESHISGVNYISYFNHDNKRNPYYDVYPISYCKIERIPLNNFIRKNGETIQIEYDSLDYPIVKYYSSQMFTYEYY